MDYFDGFDGSPYWVPSVDHRLSVETQERLREKAESEAASDARKPFEWQNRPIIRRQLNPLMIPEEYRHLPEFWSAYVPHTTLAWSPRLIAEDQKYRPHPTGAEAEDGMHEAPPRRGPRWKDDLDDLVREARQSWTLPVFGSAREAEQAAQTVWREFWAQHLEVLTQDERERFQALTKEDYVISPHRQEIFTLDDNNPAHQLQYEVWLAQFPDGLPPHVMVHRKHAAVAAPTPWTPLDLNTERADWTLDPQWFGSRTRTPEEIVWQIAQVGPTQWALARMDGGDQWEFWKNATNRPVIWSGQSAAAVEAALPSGVAAVPAGPDTPPPAIMRSLFTLAHTESRQRYGSAPEITTWLAGEITVGQAIQAWAQESPEQARRAHPVMQAVGAVHTQVFPADGLLAGNFHQLDQAYDHLDRMVSQRLPQNARERVAPRVHAWRRQAGDLNRDRLGLFQYNRVPDIAFEDPRVTSEAYVEHTGEWMAHQMPSGVFVAARLRADGTIGHVDVPTYRSATAVRERVADSGGVLTFQNMAGLEAAWKRRVRRAYGPDKASQVIAQTMAPSFQLQQDAYRHAQAVDPRPVRPEPAVAPIQLGVTPIGAGRALIWKVPEDAIRKDQDPEFVVWRNGKLVPLNKRHGDWLPPLRAGETRDWNTIPLAKKPWIVRLDTAPSVAGFVRAVQERVPGATVTTDPLPNNYLIRALAERYGVRPQPLTLPEAVWTLHPAPGSRDRWMLSHRRWVDNPKEDHPGEYDPTLELQTLRMTDRHTGRLTPVFDTRERFEQGLRQYGYTYRISPSLPPEIAAWADDQKPHLSLDPRPVRWGPVDPWTAIHRGPRDIREVVLADLEAEWQAAQRPPAQILMAKRLFATGHKGWGASDWKEFAPTLAEDTGISWEATEQQLRSFCRDWLAERPALAERLTRSQPPLRGRPTPAVSFSV